MDEKNDSGWTGPDKLVVKSKIWIEDAAGDLVFGSGRLRLLMAVAEYGSLLAAAKAMGMGYRAAWGKIKATEERLGKSLLDRRIGGSSGGGSDLTPFGKSVTLLAPLQITCGMLLESQPKGYSNVEMKSV